MERKEIFKSYGLYSLAELEEIKRDYEDEELEDFDERIAEYINDGFNTFLEELDYSNLATLECTIEGVLGLWNGPHTIIPTNDTLKACILRCVNDGDEIEIFEEDGELKINTDHHDGTNRFTINLESGLKLNLMNKLYGA